MKTVILIPARQTSTRLPLKHLYPLSPGMNTFDLLEERLGWLNLPTRLFVGQEDRLYEEIGKPLFDDVIRTNAVKDGDLMGTLWEGSEGFERVILVYGDSPLVDSNLVNRLLEWTGTSPFGWADGVKGLRPMVFTRGFLRDWIAQVYAERTTPFGMLRWPFTFKPLRLKGQDNWALDTLADVAAIRELVSAKGISVPYEEVLKAERSIPCSL